MPSDFEQAALDLQEDVRTFRYACLDCLLAAADVLGEVAVLQIILPELVQELERIKNGQQSNWRPLEGWLYLYVGVQRLFFSPASRPSLPLPYSVAGC